MIIWKIYNDKIKHKLSNSHSIYQYFAVKSINIHATELTYIFFNCS